MCRDVEKMSSAKKSQHHGGSKLIGLVVADIFNSRNASSCSPLYPLVNETDPIALVKICETPLIDFVLEQLLLNGVDTTYVLLNKSSATAVLTHLQTVRSARGKSWTDCREMKIVPVESTRKLSSVHDCVAEIIHRNLIPEDRSFVWAPLDCLHNITNLREMFAVHERNVENVPKYAATMIASRDEVPLRAGLESAVSECLEACTASQSLNESIMPTTPLASHVFPGEFQFPQQHSASVLRPSADVHRMLVAYGTKSGIVKQLHRCETRDADDGAPDGLPVLTIEFSKSERLSVRSDLMFHNLVLVGPGGLSLFEFHQHDHHEWLAEILEQQELKGNSFGLVVCQPNTVCMSIRSVAGYLRATWATMNRLFHPLTRESNFADQRAHFSVSHVCHTVLLHNDACILGDARRAQNVLLGESTRVPSSARVQRSVLGNGVVVGHSCTIEGCVVLDGAQIGDCCTIRDSIICPDAIVSNNVEVSNHSVIGSRVMLSSSGKALCLDGVRLERCNAEESDPLLVGDRGRGRGCGAQPHSTVASVEVLFVNDTLPQTEEELDDSALNPEEQFTHAVLDIVDVAIRSPSRIENSEFELKHLRLSYGKTNGDLAKTVMQLLLQHAIKKGKESKDPNTEAFHVACALLSQWCRPFFAKFVTTSADMQQVLVGLCVSIRDPTCPLHVKAPKLLEWMYNGCCDELYDEREYCIISGPALLEFDDSVAELEEEDKATFDDEDRAVLVVGSLCVTYVQSVADFLSS